MGHVTFQNAGRCGNFLFQAATTIAYALKHEMPFTVPTKTNNHYHNPLYLQHLVARDYDPGLPEVKITEGPHCWQKLPFKDEWRGCNIVLSGYWQTEKYFKEYRSQILGFFGFDWFQEWGTVSVHVRRGDYLKLKYKHPFWSRGEKYAVDWLKEAMSHFPGFRFLFHSDEIGWCKSVFGNRDHHFFSSEKSVLDDLRSISRCEHHINSASTFAWWGAWLNRNPNKKVIVPPFWFTPGHGNLDTRDIVPEDWIKMEL